MPAKVGRIFCSLMKVQCHLHSVLTSFRLSSHQIPAQELLDLGPFSSTWNYRKPNRSVLLRTRAKEVADINVNPALGVLLSLYKSPIISGLVESSFREPC